MPTTNEIAWLAGWLEGEGSFGIKPDGTAAYIVSGCKDRDVVERYAKIVGGNGSIFLDRSCPMWKFRVDGPRAIQWMMTLLSLMGERRANKIKECLACWKARPDFVSRRASRAVGNIGTKCRKGHVIAGENAMISYIKGLKYINCAICKTGQTRPRDIALRERLLKMQEVYHSGEIS